MRTLRMLLFLMLSSFWQPSEALAIVQTVKPATTIQQTASSTTLKQTRLQKKLQKWSNNRGSGLNMSGDMKWLWWGIGFLILAWLANNVLAILGAVLGLVAIICLAMWVLKFFNIM